MRYTTASLCFVTPEVAYWCLYRQWALHTRLLPCTWQVLNGFGRGNWYSKQMPMLYFLHHPQLYGAGLRGILVKHLYILPEWFKSHASNMGYSHWQCTWLYIFSSLKLFPTLENILAHHFKKVTCCVHSNGKYLTRASLCCFIESIVALLLIIAACTNSGSYHNQIQACMEQWSL